MKKLLALSLLLLISPICVLFSGCQKPECVSNSIHHDSYFYRKDIYTGEGEKGGIAMPPPAIIYSEAIALKKEEERKAIK